MSMYLSGRRDFCDCREDVKDNKYGGLCMSKIWKRIYKKEIKSFEIIDKSAS